MTNIFSTVIALLLIKLFTNIDPVPVEMMYLVSASIQLETESLSI